MGKLSNISPYKGGGIPSLLQKWLDILYDALRGHLITPSVMAHTGCIPSNGSDATNDIDFSAGVMRDSSNVYSIHAASAMTKRADATWAAGTGNGGMAATLTFSATTTYHHFLLGRTSDPSAFDYIFDSSVTCATGLADPAVIAAGFNIYKRVSSGRTGAGAAWRTFSARGVGVGVVRYRPTPLFQLTKDWSGTDDAAQTGTLDDIPDDIKVKANLGVVFRDSSATAQSGVLITSLDQPDTAASPGVSTFVGQIHIFNAGGADVRGSAEVEVETSTSRTFRYRGNGTTVDHSIGICLLTWEDSIL